MNLSLLYALPAIPIFALAWKSQVSAERNIRLMSKEPTSVIADQLLKQFLTKNALQDVEVVKSDNYMQNEYDAKDGKIYLSPDTIGSVDVSSVALALRAGAQANASLKKPESVRLVQKLHSIEILWFWLVFCILAFGIMSASAPISIVGYACVIVIWGIWRYKLSVLKSINTSAINFLKESQALSPELTQKVERVMNSVATKI